MLFLQQSSDNMGLIHKRQRQSLKTHLFAEELILVSSTVVLSQRFKVLFGCFQLNQFLNYNKMFSLNAVKVVSKWVQTSISNKFYDFI